MQPHTDTHAHTLSHTQKHQLFPGFSRICEGQSIPSNHSGIFHKTLPNPKTSGIKSFLPWQPWLLLWVASRNKTLFSVTQQRWLRCPLARHSILKYLKWSCSVSSVVGNLLCLQKILWKQQWQLTHSHFVTESQSNHTYYLRFKWNWLLGFGHVYHYVTVI